MDALAGYSDAAGGVARFVVDAGQITEDKLDEVQLRRWVDGFDPVTGERRGRDLTSPEADLLLDGTINAPKSYSIAALLGPELADEFEALQDRLRDRVITLWQRELNARRGAGGRIREPLRRIEVVELRHRRSRALDPHIHRHLWLTVKVLGEDGKWSNIDSRVAMKMHTLVNAEGELAARTDPRWVAALARYGYTLDVDGEIAQLAHAVRPLSRRSNQIEANRAMLLARWHAQHPHRQPSPDQLQQIDRLAWATARPNKPGDLDETSWEDLVLSELTAIDPALLHLRAATPVRAVAVEGLDVGLLAARAVVEADARAAGCGGRFGLFDLRAGAMRALAAAGVVDGRDRLQSVIDEVVARGLTLTTDLLEGEADRPAHVKGYLATATAALKTELADRFDALSHPGEVLDADAVLTAAADVLTADVILDPRQIAAAAAIAGTDILAAITGPAGAGKTTMLKVAHAALRAQGRRMVVVAPTKKAASVAGREIGTHASSLHALLGDHGWRWGRDDAGAEMWTRLHVGDSDPATGVPYEGPRRYVLQAGDRVVVDEAGMVDLHTANALAVVAQELRVGIAMVGDPLQARPVGHSGAMATMAFRSTAVVELTAVHRFRDPHYAALTLRMREPASKEVALAVAAELDDRGLIRRVNGREEARDAMVDAYFRHATSQRRVALVTGSNEDANAINEAIQHRRLAAGELSLVRIGVGRDEQRLLEGDLVQTRRNDRHAGVENRAVWVLRRITDTGIELVSASDSGVARTISHEYAANHVHLAYASTVHGIQGETADASVVGPGVDAAGLYVGMTRGRDHNEAIAISHTAAGARDQIADSMLRGIPEVSIDDSRRAASIELDRAARHPAPSNVADGDLPGPVGAGGHCADPGHDPVVAVRRDLAVRKEWLDDAKRRLLSLDAALAAGAARLHARGTDQAAEWGAADERAALVDERAAKFTAYTSVLDDYRAGALDPTPTEHAPGDSRTPAVSAAVSRGSAGPVISPSSRETGPRR
ncbi:AAA family ATPase [Microbacterium trichothecenolyticum]|uniref:ATP-dependent RecD-like DNA helicase n=1 Tax=Microbacterium trichothecenolyticum TaxID=69370 RepID=A0A0M2HLG8_MICTR|nr:AAA family ATPase [Microbacterium trichothecenolyticum]KJL45740.1 ATP-dependent RecD-like DNA helicase [Microbacterium trichothecenolyticum]